MIKKDRKINLLEGDIFKKILLLSAPLMATSFINMAYNMTDTAWVGRLGKDAVAAAGTAGFFVWFAAAIATISRVGTSVYASHEYGSNHKKHLNNTIKNGLTLSILLSLIYSTFIILFTDSILNFYNLTPEVHKMGVIYLKIFTVGFIISSFNNIFSNTYNTLGNSVFPFKANVAGLIFNIVMDPIMIFGFGPIPKLGIAGAAWASTIAQLVVFFIFIVNILKTKNDIYDGIVYGKIDFNNMYQKFIKGFPSGLMSAFHAGVTFILAKYMSNYGTGPVAAYTVGTIIESITWMSCEGFQGGIIAFVGQNYGAKLYIRLKEVIKKSMIIVIGIGMIGTFVILVFRYPLFKLFLPSDSDTLYMGVTYLLILGMSQLGMATELGSAGVFNGLGKTKTPAIISMSFNFIRIPLALSLMPHFQYAGIWMSMTISSNIKGLVSLILLRKEYKKLK